MIEVYSPDGQPLVGMSAGGRTAGGIVEWARLRMGAGLPLADVQAEALDLDGVCIVLWPSPAEEKQLIKHIRRVDADLTGMPQPRQTVGPLVFAPEVVPDVPPLPERVTKVQLLLALMGTVPPVISPADLDAWLENRAFPAGITAAFDAAQVPDDLRRLARLKLADGEGGVSRSDDLIGLLQAAMGADEAQFDAFWRAAAAIPT